VRRGRSCKGGLFLFAPLILLADGLLFFRSEVVLDVECLADLLRGLALDHVGNSLACNIQQGFDIQVVSGLREGYYPLTHSEIKKIHAKKIEYKTYQDEFE
jgi:hypothetical protein